MSEEWKALFNFLKGFLKNPINSIRFLPDLSWKTLIAFQVIIASSCGLLTGIVSGSLSKTVLGTIMWPISSLIIYSIVSGFFYYLFLFFLNREINYKQIVWLMVFANIPFLVLSILTVFIKPVVLVGMAASGILLIVGFVDYFILPKKLIIKVVASLYLVFFGMWVFNSINFDTKTKIRKIQTTPESLDILEKELKEN